MSEAYRRSGRHLAYLAREVLGARMGLSLEDRAHEWDFRAGPGSKMDGSFVAMEVASGGAGPGEETA